MDYPALKETIRGFFGASMPPKIGVAVSGGSDSIALLRLLADCGKDTKIKVIAATVNHRLRPEAQQEAAFVAQTCQELGVPHETLHWVDWDKSGNLQDQARKARFSLLAAWAKRHETAFVATGHTADDQAETVLMRLARGAGVDGLSAIPARRVIGDVTFVRPLLGVTRADLRGYLGGIHQSWVDDPSNANPDFDRVRIREALRGLGSIGIDATSLGLVAQNMARARDALNAMALEVAKTSVRFDLGDVIIDHTDFCALEPEAARRIMAAALCWVSGAEYGPRGRALNTLLDDLRAKRGMVVHGCQVLVSGAVIRAFRDLRMVQHVVAGKDAIWDGRWIYNGPGAGDITIRALGVDGLAQCPNWRDTGRPQACVVASPSAWDGPTLLAAPYAGLGPDYHFELKPGPEEYLRRFIAH